MRLIFIATYHATQTLEQIDAAMRSVTQFCGIDTLGGLCVFNDDFHVEYQEETRIDFAIAMKMVARVAGMYFHQPIAKLENDILMNVVRHECRKRGWEGNYLLVPPGWKFIAHVDTNAIENHLDSSDDASFVYLPGSGDWTEPVCDAPEADFVWRQPTGSAPRFGKLEELLSFDPKGGSFAWSNGGHFRPLVVEKA